MIKLKINGFEIETDSASQARELIKTGHIGRPVGSKNRRRVERRKDCFVCGKKFKRLGFHMLKRHPEEYKKVHAT